MAWMTVAATTATSSKEENPEAAAGATGPAAASPAAEGATTAGETKEVARAARRVEGAGAAEEARVAAEAEAGEGAREESADTEDEAVVLDAWEVTEGRGSGGEERSERTNSSGERERGERGQAAAQNLPQQANGADVSGGDIQEGADGLEEAGGEEERERGAIAGAGDGAGGEIESTIESAGNLGKHDPEATPRLLPRTDLGNKLEEVGRGKTTEHISQRTHEREARGREGGYCETVKRAPRKRRQEGERHEFRVVHIAKAGRRMMERLAELPRGDG